MRGRRELITDQACPAEEASEAKRLEILSCKPQRSRLREASQGCAVCNSQMSGLFYSDLNLNGHMGPFRETFRKASAVRRAPSASMLYFYHVTACHLDVTAQYCALRVQAYHCVSLRHNSFHTRVTTSLWPAGVNTRRPGKIRPN